MRKRVTLARGATEVVILMQAPRPGPRAEYDGVTLVDVTSLAKSRRRFIWMRERCGGCGKGRGASACHAGGAHLIELTGIVKDSKREPVADAGRFRC